MSSDERNRRADRPFAHAGIGMAAGFLCQKPAQQQENACHA